MTYKGKIVGALLGSFTGPLGIIIGGLIGHLFDVTISKRLLKEDFPILSNADHASYIKRQFLFSLIGLSIAIAHHEGPVKTSHIKTLKGFFHNNLAFEKKDYIMVQNIIDKLFLARDKLDIKALTINYAKITSTSGRILLLRLLFMIARADKYGITYKKEKLINYISCMLETDPYYESIKAEFIQNNQNQRGYKILGVSLKATDQEIKRAYKKLILKYHPDKVTSLGKSFVKISEEKFKIITNAYDEIKKDRGF